MVLLTGGGKSKRFLSDAGVWIQGGFAVDFEVEWVMECFGSRGSEGEFWPRVERCLTFLEGKCWILMDYKN